MKFLKLIGNVLWFCTFGIALFMSEIAAAVASFCLIVPIFFGIPLVHIKHAIYVVWPFGKKIKTHFMQAPIRNAFSFVLGGFCSFITGLVGALFFAITIVGFPVAKILFNVAKLSVAPFRAEIAKK